MSPASPDQIRVLVIDDESFVRNLTVRILGNLGYTKVVTAENGAQAVEKLIGSAEPFDLVICDLNMPKMDGVEFLRHAALQNFNGGVVFVSGEDERIMDSARDLARVYDLNILGVMPKPMSPEKLRALLEGYQPRVRRQAPAPAQEPVTSAELKAGIDGRSLLLVYQPKVHMRSGEIHGVEVLARWQHPQRGVLGPGTFIALAEELGLIDELTKSIYRRAVTQSAEWQAKGIRLKMAVNFAVNSFTHPELVDFLISVPQVAGVDPALQMIEVTETQIMADARNCLESLMRLRLKKFGLSIDDFGTAHSSMEQLKRIPFNELKIDRAFVSGSMRDASARAILELSVDLARKLKMQIVAEGVETREDWDLVASLDCDYVQGYYCARPMPAPELEEFLKNWKGPHKIK